MNKRTILVLNGSPRRRGSCSQLLEAVLDGIGSVAPDTAVLCYDLYELNLKPCIHCDGCLQTGKCIIRDDMAVLDEAFVAMAGMVVAAPIYFSHLCAQTKMMVDRCQPYWVAKYILKESRFPLHRPGLFVATGGQPQYGSQFAGASHTMRLLGKMLNVDIQQEVLVPNTDREPAGQSVVHMTEARQAGTLLGERLREQEER